MDTMMNALLIEDDPEHADLIRSQITRRHGQNIRLQWVARLAKGIEKLENESVDVVLLDLGLPDSQIDQTLKTILPKAKGVPIVVLSSVDDEDFGARAVHDGAQDYISKSRMDGELLFRSLRYAIERKAALEELRKANQAKDEFLATLSHELRTPIGVIQGFAELLSFDEGSEEDRQQAIAAILRNAKLQVRLISDMLDMSRIVTGKLTLQMGTVDLCDVLFDALESAKMVAQSKGIEVVPQFSVQSVAVWGDRTRLHQVVWNLLSNAINFTQNGGRIDFMLNSNGGWFEIVVKDNGEGIDPNFLPFVFDRFRQQDSTLRRRHGGLGLGLAIVKHLTLLHGGKVSVSSDGIGRGSTFTVSLPQLFTR